MKSIELLAPAKDLQAAVAAVDYGADALYIGGARFGARHAAGNSAEEIARAVEYAHQYGVRVHATLNTLLYDGELAEAERQARELIAAGVDAHIANALWTGTAKLPEIEIKVPETILCKDTISSMQAGVCMGYIGQTEYIVKRMRKESGYDNMKVVATGGLGKMIYENTDCIDVYDPDLTLHGLRLIMDKQK